jgi:hypothetical protein
MQKSTWARSEPTPSRSAIAVEVGIGIGHAPQNERVAQARAGSVMGNRSPQCLRGRR